MIDASIGDPALPFKTAAQYAMEQSLKTLNQYDNYGTVAHHMAEQIMDFFDRELGIVRPNWSGVGLDSYAYTNGITEGYDGLLNIFAKETEQYNRLTKQNLKPAIIMPIPTYGIFFAQPEKFGIEVIKLQREEDGSVDPEKLLELLRAENKAGKHHIVGYYDSNPNNPTGHIRDAAETQALADVFIRYNDYISYQKDKMTKTMKNPLYRELRELPNTIKVIDDMVYLGLEYDGRKAAAFMSIEEMYDNTIILAGGSKIGLTGLRTGIMIGSEHYIKKYKEDRALRQYFPSTVNMHALTPTFPTKAEHLKMRTDHLHQLNAVHLFSGKLMKALINGIDDVDTTSAERKKMISHVARARNIGLVEAKKQLQDGILGINVTTTPQAGFFHMLDFSAFKGHHIKENIRYGDKYEIGKLKDEWDLKWMHRDVGLQFCSGAGCGYQSEDLIMRTTFAMPPRDIIKLVDRLQESIDVYIAPLQHSHPPRPKISA